MRVLLGVVLIVGCGGDGSSSWGNDAGALTDGMASQFALRMEWTATPSLPGPLGNVVTVASASFNVARVQVLGDAGGGDATTVRGLNLSWSGSVQDPPPTVFPSAPPGLYSQVKLDVDSQLGIAYELTGTARIGGIDEPFRITDTANLAIEIRGYEVLLQPGRDAVMPVTIDLRDTLDAVDFGQLPTDDGVRTLDETDEQIVEVRDQLRDAFQRGT